MILLCFAARVGLFSAIRRLGELFNQVRSFACCSRSFAAGFGFRLRLLQGCNANFNIMHMVNARCMKKFQHFSYLQFKSSSYGSTGNYQDQVILSQVGNLEPVSQVRTQTAG